VTIEEELLASPSVPSDKGQRSTANPSSFSKIYQNDHPPTLCIKTCFFPNKTASFLKFSILTPKILNLFHCVPLTPVCIYPFFERIFAV
jgi:hypothetical protein